MNADLSHAKFEGTNLIGAQNLTIDQLPKVKTFYNARLDDELEKSLREKRPPFLKNLGMSCELRSVKD